MSGLCKVPALEGGRSEKISHLFLLIFITSLLQSSIVGVRILNNLSTRMADTKGRCKVN